MSYHKTIILDFDDTLAFTTNRDWENAEPNLKLIEKTNKLYDEGWTINIVTARGNISCKTRKEAADKFQPGMEKWLAKHGVKYHSISFEKPLGAYYIDDKGMTPEDFIEVKIEKLEGGLSGSDIYTDGKMVHKTDCRAHLVKAWFDKAKTVINVPHVDRIVGETLTMEYVEHDKDYFNNNFYVALGLVQQTLDKLKTIPVNNVITLNSYLARIEEHIILSNVDYFKSLTSRIKTISNIKRSFSHGDFGITNFLFKDQSVCLIDPIPDVFGCTELDAAKFIASLYVNHYNDKITVSKKALMVYNDIYEETFNYLIACELIRIYKYHPDKNFIIGCVRDVFKEN